MAPRRGWASSVALLVLCISSCGQEPTDLASGNAGLVDPSIRPSVVNAYPPDRGIGPFDVFLPGQQERPHFILLLNKAIDLGAFRSEWFAAEGFDRPVRFALAVSSSKAARSEQEPWPHSMAISVRDARTRAAIPYAVGRTYTFTLGTNLEDVTGGHPALPYRFSFTPEPQFRVVSAGPSNGKRVDSRANLVVTFNSPVDSVVLRALQVTPPVHGSWTLARDSLSALFQHVELMLFATAGSVELPGNVTDARGNRLVAPFLWTFQVRPFEIEGTAPPDDQEDHEVLDRIYIQTSGEVDTSTVREAFRIEPPTPGRFSFRPLGFLFTAVPELLTSTMYTVSISTALRSSDGTALAVPYTFFFTTIDFRVRSSTPYDGETAVSRDRVIEVGCTAAVDSTSVAAAFSIVPAIPGTLSVSPGSYWFSFTPNSLLAPSTRYTVTISTELRSSRGAHLEAPYTFSFWTGALP